MPAKMARSSPRPMFGLPVLTAAVRTSLLSCRKAEHTRVFTPVWESSGESSSIHIKYFLDEVDSALKQHLGK
jgi:hypothetical protein